MTDVRAQKFKVFVDDNYHYQDEDERYQNGEYETYEEALSVSKEIVDQFLLRALAEHPDTTADSLYKGYTGFGEDPFITPTPEGVPRFSAWDYAKNRCQELCRKAE